MNLSGIVVAVRPEKMEEAVKSLEALPGVEVYQRHPESGRLVVVQEAESVREEADGLQRIKELPLVVSAEMVYHYLGENEGGDAPAEFLPEDFESLPGITDAVVDRLNR